MSDLDRLSARPGLASVRRLWPLGKRIVVRILVLIGLLSGVLYQSLAWGPADGTPWRCEVLPLPGQRVAFSIDGREVTRWHHSPDYPSPFFFPFNGPSGASLTRMGHPGAPNHDHHRSIWFAHHKIEGVDFWSDETEGRIRQKQWLAYVDGTEEAIMASSLGWYDGAGEERLDQELVVALRPLVGQEYLLEIQSTFRPGEGRESVRVEQSNFGFLAVRVAKSLSGHFGGGRLSDSEGRVGEKAIFEKQSRWMDYSGLVAVVAEGGRRWQEAGITYFDHPQNSGYPSHWHVREDGWMGAAWSFAADQLVTEESPLVLRYLLYAHGGAYDAAKAKKIARDFGKRPSFFVRKSKRPHRQFEVGRHPVTGR